MARDARANIEITATDRTKGAVDSARKGFAGFADNLRLGVVAAAGLAALALGKVASIFGSVVEAAAEEERAIAKLNQALSDLGPHADRVSRSLIAHAAALQRQTTFGDESIIAAEAMIASFVKEEGAIKAATEATVDFAAAKGIDLVGAAELVAKSLGSSTNALARYGIQVEGAVGSSQRLESLTSGIARLFGGQAAAQAETFSGAIGQLRNAFGDLLEILGRAVIENEGVRRTIEALKASVVDGALASAALTAGRAIGTMLTAGASIAQALAPVAERIIKTTAVIVEFGAGVIRLAEVLGRTLANAVASLMGELGPLAAVILKVAEVASKLVASGAASVASLGDLAASALEAEQSLGAKLSAAIARANGALEDLGGLTPEIAAGMSSLADAADRQGEALRRSSDNVQGLFDAFSAGRATTEEVRSGLADLATEAERVATLSSALADAQGAQASGASALQSQVEALVQGLRAQGASSTDARAALDALHESADGFASGVERISGAQSAQAAATERPWTRRWGSRRVAARAASSSAFTTGRAVL